MVNLARIKLVLIILVVLLFGTPLFPNQAIDETDFSIIGKIGNDSVKSKIGSGFVTVHLGGLMSEFTRDKGLLLAPFDRNGLQFLRGGFTFGLIDRRFYQMRMELGYVGKGAKEVFSIGENIVNSKINMHYGQLTWLPVILKSGFGKAGVHLAAGGYGAYLIHKDVDLEYGDISNGSSGPSEIIFKKYDYGISIGAGAHFKQHLLEVRLERGLKPLYTYIDNRSIFNRSLSLILHF